MEEIAGEGSQATSLFLGKTQELSGNITVAKHRRTCDLGPGRLVDRQNGLLKRVSPEGQTEVPNLWPPQD